MISTLYVCHHKMMSHAITRISILVCLVICLGTTLGVTARHLTRQNSEPQNVDIPSPIAHTGNVTACQGYRLTSATVLDGDLGIDGILELKGNCSAYGPDYNRLKLTVRYENANRLRVRIVDDQNKAHVVPRDVASFPPADKTYVSNSTSALSFQWDSDPFGFKVVRKSNGEVIWDSTGLALVFEEQFVRFSSRLREGSNIQGLGQHNDNFT